VDPSNRLSGEVLVTWPDWDQDGPDASRLLRRAGLSLRLAPRLRKRTMAEMLRLVDGVVGAVVSTDPFDARVIKRASRLRVIARIGVGIDSIDLDAATRAGITVTTTPGANEETVADHTLALMLAALRNLIEHDTSVRRLEWRRSGDSIPSQLYGRTVGLIGYGRIGQAVARRLRAFDVRLLVCDPAIDTVHDVEIVSLEKLLERAEVVSLHVPLLPTTRSLIGARELAQMRRDAILVNTSRGGLIDENDLLYALEQRSIRAAALDVFESEPPINSRLLLQPNVILTPHVAGLSRESITAMTCMAAQCVIDVLSGRVAFGTMNAPRLQDVTV